MAGASGHVYLKPRNKGPQWMMKYRLPGEPQRHRKIGPAWLDPQGRPRMTGDPPPGFHTRATARRRLTEVLASADAAPRTAPQGHTFGEACDEFLRHVASEKARAQTTLRDYRNTIRHDLLPELGATTLLHTITTERIDGYTERLVSEGELSRRTIQKITGLLAQILKRAKRKKWIATNPADDRERITVIASGDFNVLSVEQIDALVCAAGGDQEAAVFLTAAYTGLRAGELRALRWRDVDFTNATIHVRRNLPTHGVEKVPKGRYVRSTPLIDDAAGALDRLSRREYFTAEDDYVFCRETGEPLGEDTMRDAFYAALERAKLGHLRSPPKPIVFHDLRHTAATLAVQLWPLSDVQAYMGHEHISTTMKYVHHVPKRDAARQFSEFVRSQKAGVVVEFERRAA